MRGILWGWLFALGIVFWSTMLGLDYCLSLSRKSSLPEPAAPAAELPADSICSKQLLLQVLTVVCSIGLGFFIKRMFFEKKPDEPRRAAAVEEKTDAGNEVQGNCAKLTKVKGVVQGAVPAVLGGTRITDYDDILCAEDVEDYFGYTRQISPPTVNVRELQVKLKEFEENLANLRKKGERLMNHTDAQQKRWAELDDPSNM